MPLDIPLSDFYENKSPKGILVYKQSHQTVLFTKFKLSVRHRTKLPKQFGLNYLSNSVSRKTVVNFIKNNGPNRFIIWPQKTWPIGPLNSYLVLLVMTHIFIPYESQHPLKRSIRTLSFRPLRHKLMVIM